MLKKNVVKTDQNGPISSMPRGFLCLLIAFLHYHVHAENFIWGVGNAAFQTEGSPAGSDWREWTKSPGKIEDGSDADVAIDFWHKHDDDFSLAQKLGAGMFRMSLAWERLEPKEGQFDSEAMAHYKKMILSMRKHGLEPMVTLHHFVNPDWVAVNGGIVWDGFPSAFEKFTKFVVRELSAPPYSVKWWITLNEPMVVVLAGYLKGEFPPGYRFAPADAVKGAGHLAVAHILSGQSILELNPEAMVSISHHWRPVHPRDASSFLDSWAARFAQDFFEEQFLQSVLTGKIDIHIGPLFRFSRDLSSSKRNMNFIGVNYYGRIMASFKWWPPFISIAEGPGEKQEMGWEMYPEGMKETLSQIYARTNLPVFITENGVADRNDQWRSEFIQNHIIQMQAARSAGVPVLGYLHWTLVDNFEWAKGLSKNFGLCAVERPSLERKCRKSFEDFRQLILRFKSAQ